MTISLDKGVRLGPFKHRTEDGTGKLSCEHEEDCPLLWNASSSLVVADGVELSALTATLNLHIPDYSLVGVVSAGVFLFYSVEEGNLPIVSSPSFTMDKDTWDDIETTVVPLPPVGSEEEEWSPSEVVVDAGVAYFNMDRGTVPTCDSALFALCLDTHDWAELPPGPYGRRVLGYHMTRSRLFILDGDLFDMRTSETPRPLLLRHFERMGNPDSDQTPLMCHRYSGERNEWTDTQFPSDVKVKDVSYAPVVVHGVAYLFTTDDRLLSYSPSKGWEMASVDWKGRPPTSGYGATLVGVGRYLVGITGEYDNSFGTEIFCYDTVSGEVFHRLLLPFVMDTRVTLLPPYEGVFSAHMENEDRDSVCRILFDIPMGSDAPMV
ncbi:hypothetical protein KIPB_004641 [Kipferlia bialata]|uniref:Uncharacterized protein n=1 Tax=Kipferlia bialata TaxID=797122 RepID=A0A9K3GIE9_9EUKA|nr:hypothetical protein KIPB_004641 [Kipferlia bialata]|eukprot:g4641.t1